MAPAVPGLTYQKSSEYGKGKRALITKLQSIDTSTVTSDHVFISLDVVNLYPSIPIEFGINTVFEFATTNWNKIDPMGLSPEDLKRALTFIAYNYEIEYNEKNYLQIKGCPMGAHFAPPFAIVVMHTIETQALKILNDTMNICPDIYTRYIDDILLGPFIYDEPIFQKILHVFNSINKSLQFTLEVPRPSEHMHFLDLDIIINDGKISHTWYTKDSHSDITLKSDGWIPRHVKVNFVSNTVRQVAEKCSTEKLKQEAFAKLDRRFHKNGFKNVNYKKILDNDPRPKSSDNLIVLKTPFVSDKLNKTFNKIIKSYDFPVRIVSKPNMKLRDCFTRHQKKKHENCFICAKLSDKYSCDDRFVVYMITCSICKKSYIGETCRPFHIRLDEHKRSVSKLDDKSALADHIRLDHKNASLTFDDFYYDVISKFTNPIETRIGESRLINILKPQLNRRHEMAQW